MRILHLCFDLDDTLLANSYRYNAPIWRCGQIISEALGRHCPYATDLMKLHYDTDSEMVKTWNFRADRFPTSWVRVYEQLAARTGIDPDPEVSHCLYEAANEFQSGPFMPLPGVLDMLALLRADGRRLHLITAGDAALQHRKLSESGLAPMFDTTRVLDMRKDGALAELFGHEPQSAAMVGDSLKSDIKPAIDLGMTAIHVPSFTWAFVHADVDSRKYHTLRSILDLPELLDRLDAIP